MTTPAQPKNLTAMANDLAKKHGAKPADVAGLLMALQSVLKDPIASYAITANRAGVTPREMGEDMGRMAVAQGETEALLQRASAKGQPPQP